MVGRRLVSVDSLFSDSKMRLVEFLVLVLATLLLSVVVFALFRVLFPPMVGVEQTVVPARWWPWSITSYNHWPYWMGGGSSSSSSGSHVPLPSASRHHGDKGDHSRPWGGAQRGANGGAGHHA